MKKILVVIFIFFQFSFFAEALDEFEEAIETLDELDKTDEIIKSKSFYEMEYDDIFFEMGILYIPHSKDDFKPILGMGVESKYKNSYIIFQNCIDLVYLDCTKNNADFAYTDFVWTPTFFLGNSIIKIGVGTPLGIGGYIYEDIFNPSISIGARFSVKLTTIGGCISLEAYYQHLTKGVLSTDYTIESDEFGLTLKINMGALIDIIK